jgi:hypothetical protein
VLGLLDRFEIRGINEIHRRIIAGALGPAVSDVCATFKENRLSLHILRSFAMWFCQRAGMLLLPWRGSHRFANSIASAVVFSLTLHLDLHILNVLLSIPDLRSWAADETYKHFGKPITSLIIRIDE